MRAAVFGIETANDRGQILSLVHEIDLNIVVGWLLVRGLDLQLVCNC